MPEAMRPWGRIGGAALAGLALTLLLAIDAWPMAVAGALAQAGFALAVSWWRGTRTSVKWPRDAASLAGTWIVGVIAVGALVAWPLAALRETGSLSAVIGLSVVAAVALLVLWQTWPTWHALEREGGAIGALWRALSEVEAWAWRGLGVAAIVAVLIGAVLALAWPGLVPGAMRWPMVIALCVVGPVLHLLLQRVPAATTLPIESLLAAMEPEDDVADPGPAVEDDLDLALYAAARGGRVDRAMSLLDMGANPHALPAADDRDQRTLPMLAAILPDLRLLRALIQHGVDVNAAHGGMAPLLAATRDSWHGRPEAVMTLLANGADPRVADSEGNTPLHHAARSSDPGVAALLRDAAADIDPINRDGITPLGIACQAGNWRLARFLLERGAKPELPNAAPALLAAAGTEEDDVAGVQLLLKHKAKADARDARGRSALNEAARCGHVEIVNTLLAAGADVHARDIDGRTPWLDAARGGHLEVLERLLPHRPDFAIADHDGRDALMLASTADNVTVAIVRRLLDLGLDPARADNDGRRAADHAAAAGRWTIVSVLDPAYPLPAAVIDAGATTTQVDRAPVALLRDAIRDGRFDDMHTVIGLLSPRELGAQLRELPVAGPGAPANVGARIDWLLAQGADPDVREGLEDNAMFALLAQGPAAVGALQALLRRAVSPAGAGGFARFLGACVASDHAGRGLEQLAIDLLERGADAWAPSSAGDPPLALAVRLGWLRVVERLVAQGVDLDARDSHGMTALHLAAALGRESALKALIAHGADPDMRAADGQTPLGVALSSGRRDLADWLDWRGWPLPGRPLVEADLPSAAIVGEADAVRRLLDLGLSVDATDAQGCTALLRAAGGGHRAVVDLLLARGADPRLAARSGATPLSAAVSMRQVDIVERLLAAGAPLEQRLPGDVTVLMLAAALGLPDLVARLLTAGADVHAGDAQGLAPLHCAALYGFTARERPRLVALLDTLLLAGAEADQPAAGGVTPLLLLLGARAEPGTACDEDVVIAGLERLLDETVALDARDPRGFGPLHLAALHGLLQVVQRLLRAGADPDLRDGLNRSAREIAVMRGFVDVAAEFVPATPGGVSMARFLREPR
jgi:ankyrin repeat protein